MIFEDSMPETTEDYRLDHDGFLGMKAWCRLRIYRPEGKPAVLVATDPYDVEDSGVNPMNGAEIAFAAAWRRAGEPWPAIFVCHFAGEVLAKDRDKEQWTRVLFPSTEDGPRLTEATPAGEMIAFGRDLEVLDHKTEVRYDLGFREPKWKRLTRAEMEKLIGEPMPIRRFEIEVEPATIENSPTKRWLGEHFPEE